MRFVTYLASAALVARADVIEEDDDLSFMRMLSSNASNTTVTDAPVTDAPVTNATVNTTATETDAPVTTQAASSDSNTTSGSDDTVTTQAASSGSNTTSGSEETVTTQAASSSGSEGGSTETQAASSSNANAVSEEAQASQSSKAANVTEGTDMEATTEVEIVVSHQAEDPLGAAIANDGVVAATTAAPAESESATNSTRRRLDVATLVKAHNLFCGAFAFTASASVCEALGDAALLEFFGGADAEAAKGNCYTGVTADAQSSATGFDDDCSSTTAGSLGVCYESSTVAANAAMSGTTMYYGETKACTLAVTASGSSTFTTSTMMALPTWLATASEDSFTVDVTAIESAAETNAASSEASAVLTNALVIAAVAIATDPDTSAVMDPDAGLGVNLTQTLGIPEDTFTSIVASVEAGGGVAAIPLADLAAEPDATEGGIAALMATAVAAVEATYAPTTVATTATTSSMASMVTASAALGLLSLVF